MHYILSHTKQELALPRHIRQIQDSRALLPEVIIDFGTHLPEMCVSVCMHVCVCACVVHFLIVLVFITFYLCVGSIDIRLVGMPEQNTELFTK